jgi:hypothetical protein
MTRITVLIEQWHSRAIRDLFTRSPFILMVAAWTMMRSLMIGLRPLTSRIPYRNAIHTCTCGPAPCSTAE